MRALVQRAASASVRVETEIVGAIGPGLCALLGVGHEDDSGDARRLADRIANLRVFTDSQGKMNLSLLETGGELLAVSQFTLMGDTRRGRRPSFGAAAEPQKAAVLVDEVVARARELGIVVAEGRFGAHMMIELLADGPVTLMLDSREVRSG